MNSPLRLAPLLLLAALTLNANQGRFPAAFDTITPRLMRAHNVPGVSIAWIQNHEVTWTGQYGVKAAGGQDPVQVDTMFEAASMSKPVFAYLVLQQVQAGKLDLDTTLVTYLGGPYEQAGEGHELITMRMALAHSGGMPNWRPGGRRGGGPIPQLFEPGTDFRYSGEGMWFAQRAAEQHLGRKLDRWAQEDLFRHIGMENSSYVWLPKYDEIAASGHNARGRPAQERRSIYRQPNSAFTLYTTPTEYARFLIEMMKPDRSAPHSLKEPMLAEMLSKQTLTTRDQVDRGSGTGGPVYFGLGWRVEETPNGVRVMHSGSNRSGFRCFSEFNPATGAGVVIMTNAASGNNVWQTLRREIGAEL